MIWNYPVIIPLLAHYFPERIGYEATQGRLADIAYRLDRLEEYLVRIVELLGGDARDIRAGVRPIDAVSSFEEDFLGLEQKLVEMYVSGISDIRLLGPQFGKKGQQIKLPKFVVPMWIADRQDMVDQARELGLPLPIQYLEGGKKRTSDKT